MEPPRVGVSAEPGDNPNDAADQTRLDYIMLTPIFRQIMASPDQTKWCLH
jgi:hypothetical protein